MQSMKGDLEKLQEKLRGMLYQSIHYQDEFERNRFADSKTTKESNSIVNDALKSIIVDVYKAIEVINEILERFSEENDMEN